MVKGAKLQQFTAKPVSCLAFDSRKAQCWAYPKGGGSWEFFFEYVLNENRRARWLEFWRNSRHSHAQQHFYHAEIEPAKRRKPIFFFGAIDGKIVSAGIFSIRPLLKNKFSFEAVCLRGPIFDSIEDFHFFLPQLIKKFKQLGVGILRISPHWQYPEALVVENYLKQQGFRPYYPKDGSQCHTGYVDLRIPDEQMYARLSKSAKLSVKSADKLGVTFKNVTDFDEIEGSYRLMSNMQKKNGLSQLEPNEFKAAFRSVMRKQDIGLLTNAYKEGQLLATFGSMRGPRVAHVMIYALDHEMIHKLVPHKTMGHILWWQHFLWAKRKGVSFYNVEGYRAGADNSHPMKQIWDFKEKLGPEEVCILSEHILVCNKLIYCVYKFFKFGYRFRRFVSSIPYQWKKRICKNFGTNDKKTEPS